MWGNSQGVNDSGMTESQAQMMSFRIVFLHRSYWTDKKINYSTKPTISPFSVEYKIVLLKIAS